MNDAEIPAAVRVSPASSYTGATVHPRNRGLDWLIGLFAIGAVWCAGWLIQAAITRYLSPPPKIQALQRQLGEKETQWHTRCVEWTNQQAYVQFLMKQLGDEPDWFWHPWEHYWWHKKKANYDKAVELREALLNECNTLLDAIKDLKKQLEEGTIWKKFWRIMAPVLRWCWTGIVAPILHLILALSLIGIACRVVFRWLLMTGRIGWKRV
jgi:hypothetical protein